MFDLYDCTIVQYIQIAIIVGGYVVVHVVVVVDSGSGNGSSTFSDCEVVVV